MVNNIFKILDEGKIKFCPEVIYMKQSDLYSLVLKKKSRTNTISTWSDEACDFVKSQAHNDDYKEPTPRIKYALKKYYDYIAEWDYINWPKGPQNLDKQFVKWCGGEKEIYDYLEIIPFTPSVMINISPNWGDKPQRASKLKELINSYMSEGWYDKWQYVIECGSEGNHIHAHIVAHMNVQRLKSVESHLRKGNHTRQLQKWSKKIEGMGGTIEGVSVQKTILRTEQLVNDKLDYLIEEKKPVGHKNHHIVPNGFVSGQL